MIDFDDCSGVYCIRCMANGKIYVGSALNVRRRSDGHRLNLRKGKHPNAHLQSAWDKYGEHAFVFYIIERTEPSSLIMAEQRYIDLYDSANRERGFNIRVIAESNRGLKTSEVTRAKLSAAGMGHPTSNETRRKIGAKHKGKTINAEAREKMAVAKRGKKLSDEHRDNLSVAVRARGPEYHAKLSASKIGNKNSLGRVQPPEVLAKISAASKVLWSNPEHRAKISEKLKRANGFIIPRTVKKNNTVREDDGRECGG